MKKMKRLLALILATAVLLTCVSVTAFAASYPLITVDYDESSQTIMKGETGQIRFMVLPEYHNEQYHVNVYNSSGRKVASAEKSYYNADGTGIRYFTITINTADLDMAVGTYKAEYWLSYYSFQSWHDAPNKYTYTFQVTPYVCTGAHVYDSVCDANCNACGEVRSVTHTYSGSCDSSCDVCGATRTAIAAHTYSSSADSVCDVCGYTRVAIDPDYSSVIDSGTCGSNLTWQLTAQGTLSISGTGTMYGYSSDNDAPWYDYRRNIKQVVISEGVTSIGNYAFYYNNVEKVSIPSTVTKLGEHCFTHCETLRQIILPDGIKTIPKFAFYECSSLEAIEIPSSVGSFGQSCFDGCSSLQYFIVPDGVTEIASGMFWGCSSMEYVQIPSSVTSIRTFAFHECGSLSDVYFTGTQSQYQAIDVDRLEDYNEGLIGVTVHYSSRVPCSNHTFGAWGHGDAAQHIKTCIKCSYFEEAPHTWDNGQVTKPADCKEPGEKTFTCTVCGRTRKEGTPIGDHTWGGNDCNKQQTCTVCGIDSNGPVGHRYDDNVDGTCNNCGVNRETVEVRQVTHMFRMYNPNTGEHFYTGSEVEKGNLVAAGWHYEGIGFTFPANTGAPVHRLFQPSTGEHLYTMNEAEKNTLMANGWNYEGIAFNSAYNTEAVQHRLHNPNATVGAYHFTFSEVEKQNLIAAGWEYQGIGWYSCWK